MGYAEIGDDPSNVMDYLPTDPPVTRYTNFNQREAQDYGALMPDDFDVLKGTAKSIRESQRDKRTRQLLELIKEGYDIVQLMPYQYRVNGRLDIYPTWARWHDIKLNKRGTFKGTNTKEFVKAKLAFDAEAEK